jgi:putative transposase
MKSKRFSDEQIIRILHAAEAGFSVADICRKHNCSEESFCRWKAKFGGMDISDAKRLRELVRENAELKKMVAEQALDIRMLKDVNSRKW